MQSEGYGRINKSHKNMTKKIALSHPRLIVWISWRWTRKGTINVGTQIIANAKSIELSLPDDIVGAASKPYRQLSELIDGNTLTFLI